MKKCSKCGVEKTLDQFHKLKHGKYGRASACKECSNKADKDRYYGNDECRNRKRLQKAEFTKRNQQYVYEYLLLHPCVDCGEADPVVLEFDHRTDKKRNICEMISKNSLLLLKIEIDKCDVRCANCHRKKTAREYKFYTYKNANASELRE